MIEMPTVAFGQSTRCVLATTLLPARHCRPLEVLGLPSAAYRVCAPVLAVADHGRWTVPRLAKARGPPSWSQDPDSTPTARQRVQRWVESRAGPGQWTLRQSARESVSSG